MQEYLNPIFCRTPRRSNLSIQLFMYRTYSQRLQFNQIYHAVQFFILFICTCAQIFEKICQKYNFGIFNDLNNLFFNERFECQEFLSFYHVRVSLLLFWYKNRTQKVDRRSGRRRYVQCFTRKRFLKRTEKNCNMISLIFYIFVLNSPHAAFRSKFFTKLAFFFTFIRPAVARQRFGLYDIKTQCHRHLSPSFI